MIGVRDWPELGFEFPNQPRRSESVHHWHFTVHQDGVELAFTIEVYGLVAVGGMNGNHAHAFQRGGRDEGIDSVVLDKQHRLAAC